MGSSSTLNTTVANQTEIINIVQRFGGTDHCGKGYHPKLYRTVQRKCGIYCEEVTDERSIDRRLTVRFLPRSGKRWEVQELSTSSQTWTTVSSQA